MPAPHTTITQHLHLAGHRLTCVRGAVDTGHRGGGGAGGRGGGGGRGRGGGRSLARVAWSLFVIIHSNNLNIYFNLMHDDNMTMIKIGMINLLLYHVIS